jgi:hypothetical protein
MSKSADLAVGPDLRFPLDVITQSIALLAIKRAGKSNAAAVIAEEMYRAGLPWVAIDPKGDWWGLRSSGDGTGPGLPIPIFGGLHGDLPLLPEAGAVIAELIFEQNLTCILDVSEFDSKAAQMRFLTDFANRLFRLHGTDPQPRHVFLEEADEFIPQIVRAEQARCVGAWSKLVKQGGQRGLGVSIISQRSAVVNKDCLTQCDTLISLRTTSALDRKAIAEWVSYHAVARELVDSLPGLDDGEAWVVSPHWLGKSGQPAVQRRRFRRRETFDSGATPTVTRKRPAPTIADIDLGAVLDRMQTVVEKAAQADPAALRKRIAELERQARVPADSADVARLTTENRDLRAQLAAAQAMPAEQVEVPVLQPGDAAAVEQAITGLRDVAASLELALSRAVRPAPAPARRAPVRLPAPRDAWPRTVPDPADPSGLASLPVPDLSKAQRAVLTVLAQFPDGRTKRQLAMLAGYSAKGGGFNNSLSSLRTAGLIERGEPVRATDAGLAALGEWEPLPEGPALIDHWMGQLSKAESAALRALLDAYPAALTKAEVAAQAGYEANGGGFNNALSRLRTLQLIDGRGEMRADETLASAALLPGSTR